MNTKWQKLYESLVGSYRSVIINGLNKLVYRIEGDIIYIAGFWNTRMNDETQATQVK